MNVSNIPVYWVEIHGRLRDIDYDYVGVLADSIREIGLLHPITVCRARVYLGNAASSDGYRVVAGAHRLEAFRRLGLAEIPAVVVEVPELERVLVEIDENLIHAPLTPLQRDECLMRRKEVYEALHPETRQHVAGAHAANAAMGKANDASEKISFASDTAKKTGVSTRTVEMAVRRAASIPEDVREAVRSTPLDTRRHLEALARMSEGEQLQVAALVRANQLDAAASFLSKPLAEVKRGRAKVRALRRAWKDADKQDRRAWIEETRGELERELGVHPKLRSKPKLCVVAQNDSQQQDEGDE